jgi:hypothetical protein
VVQVLALEEDPHSPGVLGKTLGLGEERRPAGVVLVQVGDLGSEFRVGLGLLEGLFKLVKGGDQ